MFDRIAITTDGSESNKVAIRQGLEFAKKLGVETVTAICVFDVGSYGSVSQGYSLGDQREYMVKVAESSLEYVVSLGREEGVEVVTKLIPGHPAEVIVEESKDFDLVIMGTLGKTGIERALLGSVAEKVVRMAHCPVLVCRSKTTE